jgi:hypothetical protein
VGVFRARIPVRILSGATVELFCASLQGGPQTSELRCSFVYNCMANGRRTAVFVPVSTKYKTDFLFVIIFLKSRVSGAKYLQHGSFERNF